MKLPTLAGIAVIAACGIPTAHAALTAPNSFTDTQQNLDISLSWNDILTEASLDWSASLGNWRFTVHTYTSEDPFVGGTFLNEDAIIWRNAPSAPSYHLHYWTEISQSLDGTTSFSGSTSGNVAGSGATDYFGLIVNATLGTGGTVRLTGSSTVTDPVMSPIPEADIYALMLTGLGTLSFFTRRKERHA